MVLEIALGILLAIVLGVVALFGITLIVAVIIAGVKQLLLWR